MIKRGTKTTGRRVFAFSIINNAGKMEKEVSSDERVFVSTKEVCEGFVCAFFAIILGLY